MKGKTTFNNTLINKVFKDKLRTIKGKPKQVIAGIVKYSLNEPILLYD